MTDMYTTACLICKKEFAIPFTDYRYKDIKYNRGKHHICDHCARMIQQESRTLTGIDPEPLDVWDRVLRARSI